MDSQLRKLDHVFELAGILGLPYAKLASVIYPNPWYRVFMIPKKSGDLRLICSPSKQLQKLQILVKNELEKEYKPRLGAHGFIKGKSILTNAELHQSKRFVLNLDLEDFFGSITFGRVRRLFMAAPINACPEVATVLAQICCYKNKLPQGAPTSPLVSNMICSKLDKQLLALAKSTSSTYTRYADDITFSFSVSRHLLPPNIVFIEQGAVTLGRELVQIIQSNGFTINYKKLRLASKKSRQEVTGLTVNEFPNAPRKRINKIRSILHAWDKYGYEAAEAQFLQRYKKIRASKSIPKLHDHLRGHLAHIRMIRGIEDPIFNKLGVWYNKLIEKVEGAKSIHAIPVLGSYAEA